MLTPHQKTLCRLDLRSRLLKAMGLMMTLVIPDSIESYWEVIRPQLILERSIRAMDLLKYLMKLGRRGPNSTLLTETLTGTANKVLVQDSIDPKIQPGFLLRVDHLGSEKTC
jgi:hypothetical protein